MCKSHLGRGSSQWGGSKWNGPGLLREPECSRYGWAQGAQIREVGWDFPKWGCIRSCGGLDFKFYPKNTAKQWKVLRKGVSWWDWWYRKLVLQLYRKRYWKRSNEEAGDQWRGHHCRNPGQDDTGLYYSGDNHWWDEEEGQVMLLK